METLFQYVAPPSTCGYLPDRDWSLEYEMVGRMTAAEYLARLKAGWRRFGGMLFRPRCPGCQACQSLRVLADQFRPTRSQKRAWKANADQVQLVIGEPSVSRAKLRLYDSFHAYQTEAKGWPEHPAKDAESYAESFVHNPIPVEEWCYYLDKQLIGVGYVDRLAEGLSAIYFFYDPDLRKRSLGTFNVLSLLTESLARRLPHLYLGYYVEGCRSLEYKATFKPNQALGPNGVWRDFRKG
jgi:leucyl-tRNA---protein transferase